MSGLNFTIPNTLLAGLYKDTLIASDEHVPPAEKPGAIATVPGQDVQATAASAASGAQGASGNYSTDAAGQSGASGAGGMGAPGQSGTLAGGGIQQAAQGGISGASGIPQPAQGATSAASDMQQSGMQRGVQGAEGRQQAEEPGSGAANNGMQQGASPAGSAPISVLGNNAKGIVILVKDAQNVHLAEDALQLLSGILAACRLNMGDVAVVNISRNHFNFSQIRQQLQVNYCFLFDISMQEMQLAFAIPPFQVFTHDSCTFLSAPALQGMLGGSEEAKLLKSKLWLCLKNIFNI